jgi:uncharacterized membrane protein
MHPALRIILALLGAAVAVSLAGPGAHLLAAVVGALAGLAVGEVVSLRDALARLHAELQELRRRVTERRDTGERTEAPRAAAPAAAAATPTPAAPPSFEPPSNGPPTPARRVAGPAPKPSPSAPAERPVPAPEHWQPSARAGASRVLPESPVIAFVRDYFTGGNTLVRAGVVVLFFGVAFLLRYMAEHTHIPIELRLAGVACGAIVLLVLGWRLRSKRPGYALALQGGAIGILYLTVFSALHLYSLLTPAAAFALLAALSALTAALAVLQNSVAVALLGVTGAFLAPFLAATGPGNHVVLFSYFALLNVAILGIAWFRSWRLLNLAGFAFTFVLSTMWGILSYRPEEFASTEPFLLTFFLLYVAIAVLYSTRQPPVLNGYLDGTIIFGTPIAAFGLQAAMLHEQRLALAYSALAMSGLYLGLAWFLYQRRGELQRLLVEAFIALGVAFVTLAVPLALNGRWSAASWALEGAALVWVGCRQGRRLPRACGALLQLAAGAALFMTLGSAGPAPAGTYIAALMVGIASVYGSQVMHSNTSQPAEYERGVAGLLFVWGLAWWCVGGASELLQRIDKTYEIAALLAFATVTAVLCSEIAHRFRMRLALSAALALLPVMALFAWWAATSLTHPLAHGGWLAWPFAFACWYLILRRHEALPLKALSNTLHAVALWLLALLASWELSWALARIAGSAGAWSTIAWAIVPAALLAALPQAARISWPVRAHREAYLTVASSGLALALALWSVVADVRVSSPSAPLPYLPLANPLDIVQGLVLLLLIRLWVRLRTEAYASLANLDPRPVTVALASLAFLWLNAMLLRTLHRWAGIPYHLKAMLDSTLVQTALSIFWAVLALTTMLVATRIRARVVWLTGAALLVGVVAKLFLVDLASIGTIERIVSFVGVGVLMLVLGYFSPLPPSAEESR